MCIKMKIHIETENNDVTKRKCKIDTQKIYLDLQTRGLQQSTVNMLAKRTFTAHSSLIFLFRNAVF